ncbi:putative conjugative transfer protein TraI [Orientia tsutsugamushi str. Gilliam]|uniref:Putative conjugative transfer protein TraI n=1 Tax=Orientia tsutsugamushi str. Gilliam TaxID=1359184 RepID=A0A0F3M4K3_ORITS|nr:hypothetical protein [Orientia tsutsugamushi]KJV50680.1 putative conjugative transfer protein TraI [Orientia tsutsugamushi str. Gilliam]
MYERSSRIHGYEIDTSPSAEVEIVKKYLENRGITFDKSTASSDLKEVYCLILKREKIIQHLQHLQEIQKEKLPEYRPYI